MVKISRLWQCRWFYAVQLGLDDAPQLQQLLDDCEEEYQQNEGNSICGDEAFNLILEAENENQMLIGIYDYNNILFGLVRIFPPSTSIEEWKMDLFLLHPDGRKLGIGKEMYQMVKKLVLKNGGRSINLWLKEQNNESLPFFKNCGFTLFDSTVGKNHGGEVNITLILKHILKKNPILLATSSTQFTQNMVSEPYI